MEIAVCFKIVPDYEDVIPKDWEDMENIDFTFVKKIFGCYDEAALEAALQMKDALQKAGKSVHLTAVTAGEGVSRLFTALYGAGFDEVVHISDEKIEFCPEETAKRLGQYLQPKKPDLILTGRMTGAGDSGMVPVCLAAGMGYEWITDVTDVSYNVENDRLEVWNQDTQNEICRVLDFPTVCSIGDGKHPYLRLVPLKAQMEARKKKPTKYDYEEEKEYNSSLVRYKECKQATICHMIESEDIKESAVWLMNVISEEVR